MLTVFPQIIKLIGQDLFRLAEVIRIGPFISLADGVRHPIKDIVVGQGAGKSAIYIIQKQNNNGYPLKNASDFLEPLHIL